jgi:hypothetical protein
MPTGSAIPTTTWTEASLKQALADWRAGAIADSMNSTGQQGEIAYNGAIYGNLKNLLQAIVQSLNKL